MIKKPIPRFQSESEEAKWWDQHREETARWMEEAAVSGKTTTLPEILRRKRRRSATSPTVSITIDQEDLTRARSLAAKRGLRYRTYLQVLLHEALEREDQAS